MTIYKSIHSCIWPLVEREGFGPSKAKPTDLQSAPFDRSGTSPFEQWY